MKQLWCWRCKAEMPMLHEIEFAEIFKLYRDSMSSTKEFRQLWNLSLDKISIEERMFPVRLRYEQMTGMKNCHHNAVMHHRLSMYGPPCRRCKKPLRTPQAKLCGACMFPVEQIGFPSESKTDTPSTSPSF